MSELRRTKSTAVITPIGYSRFNDVNLRLQNPDAYGLRRVASVPELISRPYLLGRAYSPSPYRYYRDWGLFGDYGFDRRHLTADVYEPYYSWPVTNYMHLDTSRGVWAAYQCWSTARRTPTYDREQPWYWRRYRYDRPVLKEYRPWVDTAPSYAEGALKAYKQRLLSRDSYLQNYWQTPYSWELRYTDYRLPYHYPNFKYYTPWGRYYHFSAY